MGSYADYLASKRKKVGLIESALAGVGSGLFKIPEGVISLGAELIDLGFGTDKAAEVEALFDKINVFEDKAKARFTGQLTSLLTQFGIPATAGFKLGTSLANKAFDAAKGGKYLTAKKMFAGLGMAGAAEAAVATDVPEVSFLARPVEGEGRMGAFEKLANRGLLGLESVAIGAVPIGGIALLKKAQKRAIENRVFNIQEMGKESLLDKLVLGLSKKGALSNEGFNTYRDFITKRRAELVQAKQTSEALSQTIDKIGEQAFSTNKEAFSKFKNNLFKAMQKDEKAVDEVLSQVKKTAGGDVAKAKEYIQLGQEQIQTLAKDLHGFYTSKALAESPEGGKRYIISEDLQKFMGQVKKTAEDQSDYYLGNFYKFFERYKGGRYAGWKPEDSVMDDLYQLVVESTKKTQDYRMSRLGTVQNRLLSLQKGFKEQEKNIKNLKLQGKSTREAQARLETLRNKINRTADTLVELKESTSTFKIPTREEALVKLKLLQEHSDNTISKMQDVTKKGAPFKRTNVTYAAMEKHFNKTIYGEGPNAERYRKALGIIDDPAEAMFLSLQKLTNMAVKNKFLDDIAQVGQKEGWIVRGDGDPLRQPDAPVRLVKIGVDTKDIETLLPNELIGKWTTPDIARSLGLMTQEMDKGFNLRLAEGLWNYAMVLPKAVSSLSKTVLNPPTQLRNFISGGFFAANSGNIGTFAKVMSDPTGPLGKKIFGTSFQPTFFRKMFNKEPLTAAEIKEYSELVREGIFNTSVRVNELREAFSKELSGVPDFFNKLAEGGVPLAKMVNWGKTGQQAFESVYQASDDFYKLMTYVGETGKYKGVVDDLVKQGMDVNNFNTGQFRETLSQLLGRDLDFIDNLGALEKADFFKKLPQKIAANVARNAVPNYDYVGQLVRGLRKMPIGNFMSFPSEIIRTSLFNAERGLLERKLGKQLGIQSLEKTGTNRLVSQLAVTGFLPATLPLASRAMFGYTGEQAEAIREFVAPWSKNSILIMGPKDKDGNASYIDFSHAFPYDTMFRPLKTIMNKLSGIDNGSISIGEAISSAYIESTSETLNPFLAPSIYTSAMTDLLFRGGVTRDGKRVFNEADPTLSKMTKSTIHVLNSLTPGFAQLSLSGGLKGTDPLQKLGGAAAAYITGNERFNTDEYGRKYNPMSEIAGIAGFRLNTVDPKDSMRYVVSGFQDTVRNSTASFTSEVLRGKPKNVSDIISEYNQTQAARFDAYKDIYKKIKAAETLGTKPKELVEIFDERLTKTDQEALLNGRFVPYKPSENVIFKAAQNAKAAGLTNTFEQALPNLINTFNNTFGYDLEAPNPFITATTSSQISTGGVIPSTKIKVSDIQTAPTFQDIKEQTKAEKYASLFPEDVSGINIASRSNR